MSIPKTTALTVLKNMDLKTVSEYIDWKMYLVSWDFRTDETRNSKEAKELLQDSRELLERIVNENLLTVDAVFKIVPASTVDYDDIVLYTDENRDNEYRILPMLRRQIPRKGLCPSLADFICPAGEESSAPGVDDYMGFFTVTAGLKVEESLKLFPDEDVYSPLLLKSLADRLAEAGAEYLHKKIRTEYWGYAADEGLNVEQLLKEQYKGIRPAPGYPCCPDHMGKKDIFEILECEKNIDVTLTESFMMQPAASVSAYIFASDKSHYFPVGPIGMDQLESYSRRKNMSPEEVKRWLSVSVND